MIESHRLRSRDDLPALASAPLFVDAAASAAEAARWMGREHTGSLVVRFEEGELGLVTDRDLALAALRRPVGSPPPTVGAVASRPLIALPDNASLAEATSLFCERCVRRLGLRDSSGELVGILSADAVLQHLGSQLGDLSRALGREFQEERDPSTPEAPTFGRE